MRIYFSLIYILLYSFHYADCSCVFPSDLAGSWYTSARGLVNITGNATQTVIPAYKTKLFGNLYLSCEVSSGKYYVFRSSRFQYLSLGFEAFICFHLSNQISSTKYIYYLGSVENTDAQNERLKIYLVSDATSPTVNSICDRTSYTAGTEHVFLKKDGNEVSSKVECPFIFRNTWAYTYTSSFVTSCSSGSYVNICSAPDTSTIAFNYTKCSSVQAYSVTGTLYCMWSSSDTSYTYVTVYNTDTTTDESTTYRFTCYVMSKSGSNLTATQYPQECLSSQTATTVTSPGASLYFTTIDQCPYDDSSDVLSMASAVGIAIGLILLLLVIGCIVLIWYYHKKRKQEAEKAKFPNHRADIANKKLSNGALFSNGKPRDSKTPRVMNGEVKLNIDTDPDIRRENSINFSMASRGGSGMDGLDGNKRIGPAPVEEPEQVNRGFADDTIMETENELTLASTFLPMSADESNLLNFTDKEIREIERLAAAEENDEDEFDMDEIDDELGLPRLSRAFTPVQAPPTLPTITYKKPEAEVETSGEERTASGVRKVKLKKNRHKKKIRVNSSKARPKSSGSLRKEQTETPFLERLKKQELEQAEQSKREQLEKEMKQIENEVLKARVSQGGSTPATSRSKSSQKAQKPKDPRPAVSTWWTNKEIKNFDHQLKELAHQRKENAVALETSPLPIIPERIVKKHQGSDILWKYKQIAKIVRSKRTHSKKRKCSGKKQKELAVAAEGNTRKRSPSRPSKRTLSITGIQDLQPSPQHPLSLRRAEESLRLE